MAITAKYDKSKKILVISIPVEKAGTMCKGKPDRPSSNYKIASSGGNQRVNVPNLGEVSMGINVYAPEDLLKGS